ncbi:MAG TPA: hypothetical protein DEA69_04100 [Microbacterium sp.]|uniref:hypothetical protein n=1 Tax=Microbacterium TaxID=33882 RepID=UPI000C41C99B|nr:MULTISPECIES: hypothetical protein [Microbacterium]MEC8763089.1 hypothetical protein [Actinomycetota bacterium]MBU20810.1 hypothetical protein [Microbacterium sp.]MCC4268221.1 hypothetical protein [Microbacterium schleiferi]HAJ16968.1 hypothetical protein [Microbacterium sp.]HBS07971.1 hypothetical protein [Microbacterium sp.]|tara:strand:- start:641 stop:1324 length:684 start_codon:yes stop_codon:yes gene_type:complete
MICVSRPAAIAALLLIAGAPLLTGCSGGLGEPSPTPTFDAAASGVDGSDDTDGSGTGDGGSTGGTDVAEAGLVDCVPGQWVLDEIQVTAFYSAVAASIPELEIVPFGTIGLTLGADGGYSYAPDYGFVLSVNAGPVTIEPRAVVTGGVTGSWQVEGGTLVLTETDSSLTVDAQLDGQAFDVGDLTNSLIESSPMLSSAGTIACTSTTLTVPYQTGSGSVDLQWDRVS